MSAVVPPRRNGSRNPKRRRARSRGQPNLIGARVSTRDLHNSLITGVVSQGNNGYYHVVLDDDLYAQPMLCRRSSLVVLSDCPSSDTGEGDGDDDGDDDEEDGRERVYQAIVLTSPPPSPCSVASGGSSRCIASPIAAAAVAVDAVVPAWTHWRPLSMQRQPMTGHWQMNSTGMVRRSVTSLLFPAATASPRSPQLPPPPPPPHFAAGKPRSCRVDDLPPLVLATPALPPVSAVAMSAETQRHVEAARALLACAAQARATDTH
jgi:hypothetical protein